MTDYPVEQAAMRELLRVALLLAPTILVVTQLAKWVAPVHDTAARALAVGCGLVVAALAYRAGLMPDGMTPWSASLVALLATSAAALGHDQLVDVVGPLRDALTYGARPAGGEGGSDAPTNHDAAS